MRRLGTQVHFHCAVGGAAHLGLEHEVELAHVGPVARAAYGVCYLAVEYNLLELCQIVAVHGLCEPLVELVALAGVVEDTGVGLAEHCLVKRVSEPLACLGDLLVDLFVKLGYRVLDEHVGAVTLLGVLVVDEGVVESINVPGGFPDSGVHENGGVNADDVVVEHCHRFPPVTLYVVLQLNAVLSVVVNG